nr:hypothetical protein [Clostridiales bacterium]
IYGFLLHYALDRKVHPYVYCMEQEILKAKPFRAGEGFVHNHIEFNIDMLMLKTKLGYNDARQFRTYETVKGDKYDIEQIARLMQFVIKKVFDIQLEINQVEQAYYDTIKLQRFLTDDKGIKIPIISVLQAPAKLISKVSFTSMMRHKESDGKWDYLNLSHNQWFFPEDKSQKYNYDFFELYNMALEDAVYLIKGFNDVLSSSDNMAEVTGDISFLNGLPVK